MGSNGKPYSSTFSLSPHILFQWLLIWLRYTVNPLLRWWPGFNNQTVNSIICPSVSSNLGSFNFLSKSLFLSVIIIQHCITESSFQEKQHYSTVCSQKCLLLFLKEACIEFQWEPLQGFVFAAISKVESTLKLSSKRVCLSQRKNEEE